MSILLHQRLAATFARLTVALAVAVSCNGSASSIVGRWQSAETGSRLEFFDDGRVSINAEDTGATGSWVILKDGRLKIEVSALGTTNTMTGVREGAALLLTDNRDTARFERSTPESEAALIAVLEQKAYAASMKADLKNLASAQEAYYADNGAYATRLSSNQYQSSRNTTVTISSASRTSWSAMATHSATKQICKIGGSRQEIEFPVCN
jgi:hypothetical protein